MVSAPGLLYSKISDYQRDDYYLGSHTTLSGQLAERLGLNGRTPDETLYRDLKNGLGLVQGGGQNHTHRPGWDRVLSPTKAESLVHAFGTAAQRTAVENAHRAGVEAVKSYIERELIEARTRSVREKTGNALFMTADHTCSREGDPLLHTHLITFNITQTADGKYHAVSNERFYNNSLVQNIYENARAAHYREHAQGIVAVGSQDGKYTTLRGVDEKVIETFSKASARKNPEVLARLREQYPNATEGELQRLAIIEGRPDKQEFNPAERAQTWTRELEASGMTREEFQAQIADAAAKDLAAERTREEPRLNEYECVRLAARVVTEKESAFLKDDIISAANRLSHGVAAPEKIEGAFHDLADGKNIIRLGNGLHTTREMQKIERGIIEQVSRGNGTQNAIADQAAIERGLADYAERKGYALGSDQQAAAIGLLSSRDLVNGLDGPAGTGKSTLFEAVRRIAERQGYQVRGYAPTGRAAHQLTESAGIKSQTVDSYLLSKDEAQGGRQLWVIDEASMLGSKKLAELLARAQSSGARVIMSGDTRQHPAISAGRMFDVLQQSGVMQTVGLSEIWRQQERGYRDVATALSARDVATAFGLLRDQGRIYEIPNREDRIQTMVTDYLGRDREHTYMITPRNADRHEVNDLIRAELHQRGELGQDHRYTVREPVSMDPVEKHFARSFEVGQIVTGQRSLLGRSGEGRIAEIDEHAQRLTVESKDGRTHQIDLTRDGEKLQSYREQPRDFAEGDRVVMLKNDRGLKMQNGEIGTVRSIDDQGRLQVEIDGGRTRTINPESYAYLDHAYAVTSHKAQGSTVAQDLYYADTRDQDRPMSQEAYVSLTRGQHDVRVYTDNAEQLEENATRAIEKKTSLSEVELDATDPGRERSERNPDRDIGTKNDTSRSHEMELGE